MGANYFILLEINYYYNLLQFIITCKDCIYNVAERVGFEPTAPCGVTGFQDQLLKPLGHLSITVLLYQIDLIISNNVIVNQARKLAHSQLFSCIVSVESNFQLLLQHLRTSLFSTYQRWQWQSK